MGSRNRRNPVVVAVLISATLISATLLISPSGVAGAAGTDQPTADACSEVEDPEDPPCNPALVDSPWGASHRGSYAQASSPFPGPVNGEAELRHVPLPGVPIQLQFSSPDADGDIAVWGSLVNTLDSRAVFKLDHSTGELIDLYLPAEREENAPAVAGGGITGAYNLLDADNHFIVGRQRSLEVYRDAVEGDRGSSIDLARRFELPDSAMCGPHDVIAGVTMAYDGMIAYATELGVVGLVPRDPERMESTTVLSTSLNGDACGPGNSPDPGPVEPGTAEPGTMETVSNSLAADRDGGIYVVTSARMYRLDPQDGSEGLAVTWSAPYETGVGGSAIRLGAGSGSTPSLMGTSDDDDRFVVITDGQDLMHVVLMWRDEIPPDWEPVSPGADRRIACEFPVTFGDATATRSLSEQSVLVSGRATVHVSNRLADETAFAGLDAQSANALAALEGGSPAQTPSGIERIDWDPATRSCGSVWADDDVSIPNGIPTMSRFTGLMYGIGIEDGEWGVRGIDFETGDPVLWIPGGNEPCTEASLAGVDPAQRPVLDGVLERLPNSCENSFYAATEIGPGGSIYTGTFLGASSYLPVAVPESPEGNDSDSDVQRPAGDVAGRGASEGDDGSSGGLLLGLGIGLILAALGWAVARKDR